MSICYHEGSREFHLSNRDISYIITVLKNGQLGQLYFGKKLHDRESFAHLLELRHRPMAVCTYEGDSTFSMEHIKQEYPSYGAGDMRYPAVEILQENGSRITDFVYQTHRIYDGKPALAGLPATYTEDSKEAECPEEKESCEAAEENDDAVKENAPEEKKSSVIVEDDTEEGKTE